MNPNPFSAASQIRDVNDEARERMLSSREWVRGWLAAAPDVDPDVPEVIGTRDYELDPEYLRGRESSCTREQE